MCRCSCETDDLQKHYLTSLYGDVFVGICDFCEHSGPVSVRKSGSIQCLSCALTGGRKNGCCGV